MSISIVITEKEILNTPNDSSLGELVRNKYWQERRNREYFPADDEHVFLDIAPDGSVTSIRKNPILTNNMTCSICGKDTSHVDLEYLLGCDHFGCHLKENSKHNEMDKCVICGKESPYPISTHIDMRIGYVEGGGQGCFQPGLCK
jgi:hypothetical protein